jgi:hypothetical protein
MKKKNYITPEANEVSLLTMQMMATSEQNIRIDKDSKGGQQLTNEQRGDWGDLWN